MRQTHIPAEIIELRNKALQKKMDTINISFFRKSAADVAPVSRVSPMPMPPVPMSPMPPVARIAHKDNIIQGNYVSVKLTGGIGNRIFKIFAALGYSERFQKNCVITKNNIVHGVKIHEQNLDGMLSKLFPDIEILDSIPNCIDITEVRGFHYTPLPMYRSNVLLKGYFQCEQYFPSSNIPTIRTNTYANTYFIHIRAGDYLGSRHYSHNLSTYYRRCIQLLESDVKYIVFSDNNDYAIKYMEQLDVEYTISDKTNQLELLVEMANCEGGICANSSFSWLGAFFQDKTIGKRFMPSVWMSGIDCGGVYPKWATIVDCKASEPPCKIYDVFIKNNQIYLISTHINYGDLEVVITVNNIQLNEFSNKDNNEPLRYFYGPLPQSNVLTIKINNILYRKIKVEKIEQYTTVEKKNRLAFATLFKDDYKFIEKMVNHYRKQGVDCFYLYYNGSILPNDLFQGPDIIYKTWDIQPYFWKNTSFEHNAQTSFLQMFQLKHFDDNEYVILADLDEFIIPYKNASTLLERIETLKKDVVKVRNHWAQMNGSIIKYNSDNIGPEKRVKCIYKGSYTKPIYIHTPRDFNCYDDNDLRMLHVINFRHPERLSEMRGPFERYSL
uniref:Glycosyltransferase family 92 protein n=1 Tax=viral metagenome TaxID=1070528 RepID=A0A6C0DLZ5_9ZZZZ